MREDEKHSLLSLSSGSFLLLLSEGTPPPEVMVVEEGPATVQQPLRRGTGKRKGPSPLLHFPHF